MAQSKLPSLTVMLLGVLACNVKHGLVVINHSDGGISVGAASSRGGAESIGTRGTTGSGEGGGGGTRVTSGGAAVQGGFSTGSMAVPREYHSATLLPNGKVLIADGETFTRAGYADLGSAELYDPSTGTFAATGNMTVLRAGHTATLLLNGRVLIAGGHAFVGEGSGYGGYAALASAELYDPTTLTFTATASMNLARSAHTATLLGNGKVLITGGFDGALGDHASAELYDPDAGTFTPTGKMLLSRAWHTATLLGDGKVLIVGGEIQDAPDGEPYSARAEL